MSTFDHLSVNDWTINSPPGGALKWLVSQTSFSRLSLDHKILGGNTAGESQFDGDVCLVINPLAHSINTVCGQD